MNFHYNLGADVTLPAHATGEMVVVDASPFGLGARGSVVKLRVSYIDPGLFGRFIDPGSTVAHTVNYEWARLSELTPIDAEAEQFYNEALAAQRLADNDAPTEFTTWDIGNAVQTMKKAGLIKP